MPDGERTPEIYNLDVKHTNQEALKKVKLIRNILQVTTITGNSVWVMPIMV